MTTDGPEAENPDSLSIHQGTPAEEQSEGRTEDEATMDEAVRPEQRQQNQSPTPQGVDRAAVQPDRVEMTYIFASPKAAVAAVRDENDAELLATEREVTNSQNETLQKQEDVQNIESQSAHQLQKTEYEDGRARLRSDPIGQQEAPFEHQEEPMAQQESPIERNEASADQREAPSAPTDPKEAVQDPGIIDIAPSPSDNGVIDVDTFDEDSGDDESDQSPASDEARADFDDANESSNNETHTAFVQTTSSEPIDLTVSPSTPEKEKSAIGETKENIHIESIATAERLEPVTRESVVDVDEPEREAEVSPPINTTKQSFVGEDNISPPAGHEEMHGKAAVDSEAVSSEAKVQCSTEGRLLGEAPIESYALGIGTDRAMECRPSPDEVRAADEDVDEEQGPRENMIVSQERETELHIDERPRREDIKNDSMDIDVREPDDEHVTTQDEAEDDEVEADGASERDQQDVRENGEGEDWASNTHREMTAQEQDVNNATAFADREVDFVERVSDKDAQRPDANDQVLVEVQDSQARSAMQQKHGKASRGTSEDESAVERPKEGEGSATNVDDATTEAKKKESDQPDDSTIKPPISGKEICKTVVRDACKGSGAVTFDSTSQDDTGTLKEDPSFISGADLQPSRYGNDENSTMDLDQGLADDEIRDKVVSTAKVLLEVKPESESSKEQGEEPSGSEKETERALNVAETEQGGASVAFEPAKQQPEANATNPVEPSNGTGTGHLAPMFGIQLSRPVKSGPVSFSSPPSFPRYSLNPQAVPFLPAKLTGNERHEKKPGDSSVTKTLVMATPSSETKGISLEERKEAGVKVPEPRKAVGVDDADAERAPTTFPDLNVAMMATKSDISTSKTTLSDTASAPALSASAEAPVQSALKTASVSKPFLKKLGQKKVSFAPTPIKSEEPSPEFQKSQTVKDGTVSAETLETVKQGQKKAAFAGQPGKEETEKRETPDTVPAETDPVKEKQRIIQVQTDEGLRREVNNVIVAMRQGNSKVRIEKKKFTVRLTTGTGDEAKLQFFKGSPPSLKLYASLDALRDSLRVRKVTNRPFVMSVAKVAPPGDDSADIINKYFIHFEKDTFEEMFSLCVASLQKQAKPATIIKKPEARPKVSQGVVIERREELKTPSQESGGVKRPAETVKVAPVSKKSKLLADKKKLLDKMAALRKKKEQKGTPGIREQPTEPSGKGSAPRTARVVSNRLLQNSAVAASTPSGPSGSNLGERGKPNTILRKTESVPEPPKIDIMDAKIESTVKTSREGMQPPKKRAGDDVSNDNPNKKARLPVSRSPLHVTGNRPVSASGVKLEESKTNPDGVRDAGKDGLQKRSATVGGSPSMAKTNRPNASLEMPKKTSGGEAESSGLSSDALTSHSAEAFVTVTKDLKKSEDEKKTLQNELESQTRLLQSERDKSLRVQQESSEAWQRIVEAVDGLRLDIGRLRRDDADRSLQSLTRCEVSSSEDFFDRLHSFRPTSWAAFEDSEIGALECALRGWHNCGPSKIRSSEGSEITLSESFDDGDFRGDEVERVRCLLREGHCLLSGWIGRSCPESFRSLEGSQRILTKEQLKANVEGLRKEGIEEADKIFEWSANALLLSESVCEKLAVYNWCPDVECMRCSWCNRRVVVDSATRFNAKSKHYSFCPFQAEDWKTSVLRNANTLGIEGDSDTAMKD